MRFALVLSGLVLSLFGAPAVRANDAAALLKQIQSAETPDVDRANAFEKIGDLAGDEAVESLAGYLGDQKWSHYARFAMQKMDGPAVTEALVKAIDRVEGDLKLGVLSTIGRRQDPAAVGPVAKLLGEGDANTVASAAIALGWIATPQAALALSEALVAEKDSARKASLGAGLLLAGQRLLNQGEASEAVVVFDLLRNADVPKPCRIAATEHAIVARGAEGVELMVEQLKAPDRDAFRVGLAVARVLPGEAATTALVDRLAGESSAERQMLLLFAMTDRGDKRVLPAVLGKLESPATEVRLAAIAALGSLGDAASVPTLLAAAEGETADAALGALASLEGSEVNAALMAAAATPGEAEAAVKALGQRRAREAVALFFRLSRSDSASVRQAAIVALGRTAQEERFLDLLGLLKTAANDAEKQAIQQAVHAAIIRSTQPDVCAETLGPMIPAASAADREFLFEQIRTAGGAKALAWMRRFATGSDDALQDAATKTLGEWLSADAGPVLLEVARGDGKFANRAMGGYIRLFRQFELPEEERVAMAAKALDVATRPNERNAALDAMTRFPCVGTFELALAHIKTPGSEQAAAKAALTIARTVRDLDPPRARAGLKKLIDANMGDAVTDAAKQLLP